MKIAVTGISGYLARVLLPLLETEAQIESIIGIDISPPPPSKKIQFVKCDVRDAEIERHIKDCDALIHLAFIVMPLRSETEMDSINIDGSKNIFNAAAKAGIKNIVYTSSIASYGAWSDNPVPIKEDWLRRPMPNFYYSRSKAAVENWLDIFEKEHPDIRIVRLRPCIFVGPKINNLMREISRSKVMTSFKGVDARIQLVWDEDIAQAIVLALKKDVRGAYNLAADGVLTPDDIARILGRRVVSVPYGFASALVKMLWRIGVTKQLHPGWLEVARYPVIVDTTKARRELGWEPSCTTEEALRRFVASIDV